MGTTAVNPETTATPAETPAVPVETSTETAAMPAGAATAAPAAPVTVHDLLTKLIDAAGGIEAATTMVKQKKLQTVKDQFANLVTGSFSVSVANWAAIEAFIYKPPRTEQSPAHVFDTILADADDALAANNADKLFVNLLMLWKAVRR